MKTPLSQLWEEFGFSISNCQILITVLLVYCESQPYIVKYQFSCGISKVVGHKKQDFWPKINIIKGFFYKIRQ
jgi:hypothetical protein